VPPRCRIQQAYPAQTGLKLDIIKPEKKRSLPRNSCAPLVNRKTHFNLAGRGYRVAADRAGLDRHLQGCHKRPCAIPFMRCHGGFHRGAKPMCPPRVCVDWIQCAIGRGDLAARSFSDVEDDARVRID